MRTGIGYDVHRLVSGRDLILGGVKIDSPVGLLGHSDADVLSHAIGDALLGAAGLGDLGEHFPDSDPQYKGISSLELLGYIRELVCKQGFEPSFIDAVIIAEAPKLSRYKLKMTENLCAALAMEPTQINLKATTEEGMGFTGRKEGMAAWAVATIVTL